MNPTSPSRGPPSRSTSTSSPAQQGTISSDRTAAEMALKFSKLEKSRLAVLNELLRMGAFQYGGVVLPASVNETVQVVVPAMENQSKCCSCWSSSTRQGSTSTYCVMKTIDGDPRLVPREAQQL